MMKYSLILIVVLGLSACGQRGPLYLPDQNSKPPKHPQEFIFN